MRREPMKTTACLLAVLLLTAAAGCTRYRPNALPAPEEGPVPVRAARVTPRETGTMVVLKNVQITADSVIGWRAGEPDRSGLLSGPSQRVAVHRSQVLLYEPAVYDGWATAGGAALSLIGAYALVAIYYVGKSG
jgi:hypothetical protein